MSLTSLLKGFWRNYHWFALGFWVLMIPPTILWWKDSVLWVALMSLYANIWISLEVVMKREDGS